MGAINNFTSPNSPPPPGPGLMGEGTTGVTPGEVVEKEVEEVREEMFVGGGGWWLVGDSGGGGGWWG